MNEKGKMIGAAVVLTHDLVPGMRRTTKRLSIVAVTARTNRSFIDGTAR